MKVSLQSIQPLRKIQNIQSLRHMPHLSIKIVGVSLDRSISLPATLYFEHFLALHLLKSGTKVIMCILYIVTYGVVEKGMEYKGEQR